MDWKNQFAEVPDTELLRTTVEIPYTINAKIKSFEPKTGVLQNTISILIAKLNNELEQSTLAISDRYGYQAALSGAVLILGRTKPSTITLADGTEYIQRSTVELPSNGLQHLNTGEAIGGNVNGRTKPVARTPKRTSKSSGVAKPRRSNGAGGDEENQQTQS